MKTEKITCEHLSAYMPYSLKFVDITDWHQFDLMALYDDMFSLYSESERSRVVYFDNNLYLTIKPILRPMSDLCYYSDIFSYGIFPSLIEDLISGHSIFILNNIPYDIYLILVSNHFDVFGLIGKGLAIDINTIEQK